MAEPDKIPMIFPKARFLVFSSVYFRSVAVTTRWIVVTMAGLLSKLL